MALLSFPSRYLQRRGYVSPGVLSPMDDNSDPAFNPDSVENQNPSPYPPPPDDPQPLHSDESPDQNEIDDQRVTTPTSKTGYAGMRQLAKMPPPGSTTNAAAGASNVALPSLNAEANPEPAPGATQAIPTSAFAGTDSAASQSQAIPSTAFPGNAATPSTTSAGVQSATQNLRDLQKPAAAPNNWAQRLALAALSLTRFAPMANQLIHPKWSEQERNYEAQQSDLEKRQKEEETAASTEAQVAQREAAAQKSLESQANIANLNQTKQFAAQDRAHTAFINSLGKGAIPLNATDPVPAGYTKWQDPTNPNMAWVSPSAFIKLPKEMLSLFPGKQEGDPVTSTQYDEALKQKRTSDASMALEAAKVNAQNSQGPKTEYEGVLREFTDPITGKVDVASANAKYDKMMKDRRMVIQTGVPGIPNAPTAAHGDEYLATLSPSAAAQVKAISEGRLTMPSASTRSQAAVQLRNAVMQYDPDFSEQRAQIRKAFTTGKDGTNIGSLNTASLHLDQLADAAEAMHNGSFTPANAAYNYFSNMFGSAAPNNFNTLKSAVSGELANALKGTATDAEIHTISQNILNASSPEQLKGAVETNLHILGAKLGTYQQRYKQQLPNDNVWSPVLPAARAIYQKHGFDPLAPPASPTVTPSAIDLRKFEIKK